MVVPTVLAINARRNCAWCSASGNGPAVMSNVVIMNLLDYESPWCPSGAHLLECVSSPSMKVDGGIDCYFLGWPGGSVIARIPTVLVVGGRPAPTVRHRGSGKMARSCSLKI